MKFLMIPYMIGMGLLGMWATYYSDKMDKNETRFEINIPMILMLISMVLSPLFAVYVCGLR